jgi:hypothetical protein
LKENTTTMTTPQPADQSAVASVLAPTGPVATPSAGYLPAVQGQYSAPGKGQLTLNYKLPAVQGGFAYSFNEIPALKLLMVNMPYMRVEGVTCTFLATAGAAFAFVGLSLDSNADKSIATVAALKKRVAFVRSDLMTDQVSNHLEFAEGMTTQMKPANAPIGLMPKLCVCAKATTADTAFLQITIHYCFAGMLQTTSDMA